MSVNTKLFSNTLKNLEPIYKVAGLNLYDKKHALIRRATFVFNFLCLNMDTSCSFSAFVAADGKEFTEISYLVPCVIYTYLANIKVSYFISHEEVVHKLIKLLKKLEAGVDERDVIEQKSIDADRIFLNRVIKIYNVMYFLLVLVFSVAPLTVSFLKYYETGEVDLMIPFPVLYPFNPYNIKIYPIVYVHQIWSTVAVSLFVCTKDYFFYTSCTYIKVQFNILKTKFEKLFSPSNSISIKPDDVITPAEFHVKFKELVTWHQELIKSVDMLEYIFTKSTLYNILASSLMICLTLFNATVIKDTALVISFFIFLCVTYLQIYFLCNFGNIISESSVEISDAVYNSKWYLMDASVGRHLILVMMRSQKQCKLTAYGFADIDLNVFMRILSNAWSYFALLKTFYP